MKSNIEEKDFKAVLANYNFTNDDAYALKKIQSKIFKYEEELLQGFYDFIFEFNHAKSFLHNKEIVQRHKEGIRNWFRNLFCGKYDSNYFYKLNIISEVHVSIGLPTHYVNAAFSFVRRFIKDKLISHQQCQILSAVDKILDINLDILTISYKQGEQSKLIDEVMFLKNVLENDGIEPYVQPIYNTKTKKIEKHECLMRLIDPKTSNAVSIFGYLDIAKKINLYEEMMQLMVKKSFNYFKDKNSEFSINLSYEDIANENFRENLYKNIETFPKAQNIIFEILETDFIEDFSIVIRFVKKVRELGCKIAIDDFGSGFSSMENILKLNPEIIKIDGSLIKDIHTSKESQTIVKNIINMAKELKAKTVAEYIHNKEVYTIVSNLGADFLQGFYLAEPQPLEEVN